MNTRFHFQAALAALAFGSLALAAAPALADASALADADASAHAEDANAAAQTQAPDAAQASVGVEQPNEEMTVYGKRLMTAEGRRLLYAELAKAKRLFKQNKMQEAWPYLVNTAEHGFKQSQAVVGHIYVQGGVANVERDVERGIGWLGVASSGRTSPAIRNYFNDIWKRIPERHVPHFEEVVEEYKSKYGQHATGVVCDMGRPLHSHVKYLDCFFEEELPKEVRESMAEFRDARDLTILAETKIVHDRMRDTAQTQR